MHIHILGICGTFMGGLAVLAKEAGHRVTGCDANVYPPMSTQLEAQGIELTQGYDPAQLDPAPDLVVIGNAMSRGNPAVEYVLNKGLPYVSGPQWLADHVLQGRWVLAVAGTHGKTTTSSMLAWVLEHAGMSPGFLIGGVPQNFSVSARLGDTPFFVVEADEYDSAFFDKRSKFVHYHPRTAILNNLEFDHADIFPDLASIERQFHHLVRTIPGEGLVIHPTTEHALERVIGMGCWTPVQTTGEGGQWQARLLSPDGSRFEVLFEGEAQSRALGYYDGTVIEGRATRPLATNGGALYGGYRVSRGDWIRLAHPLARTEIAWSLALSTLLDADVDPHRGPVETERLTQSTLEEPAVAGLEESRGEEHECRRPGGGLRAEPDAGQTPAAHGRRRRRDDLVHPGVERPGGDPLVPRVERGLHRRHQLRQRTARLGGDVDTVRPGEDP